MLQEIWVVGVRLDIGQVLFFLRVYGLRRSKKVRGQYPAILIEQAWSIKDLLYVIKHQNMINYIIMRDKARIPSGQDSSILPAWVANHSARFSSSCLLAELVV